MRVTPGDLLKYRQLRAHGVPHRQAVAQAATQVPEAFDDGGGADTGSIAQAPTYTTYESWVYSAGPLGLLHLNVQGNTTHNLNESGRHYSLYNSGAAIGAQARLTTSALLRTSSKVIWEGRFAWESVTACLGFAGAHQNNGDVAHTSGAMAMLQCHPGGALKWHYNDGQVSATNIKVVDTGLIYTPNQVLILKVQSTGTSIELTLMDKDRVTLSQQIINGSDVFHENFGFYLHIGVRTEEAVAKGVRYYNSRLAPGV